MEALTKLAKRLTGKRVAHGASWGWVQDEYVIIVPEHDEEGLLHEILHWIVATDEERLWPNLALDADDVEDLQMGWPVEEHLTTWTVETPDQRERQVCFLTRVVFGIRSEHPPGCSCSGPCRPQPAEMLHALRRLARSGTSAFELSAALTTGQSRYRSVVHPTPLGARLLPLPKGRRVRVRGRSAARRVGSHDQTG